MLSVGAAILSFSGGLGRKWWQGSGDYESRLSCLPDLVVFWILMLLCGIENCEMNLPRPCPYAVGLCAESKKTKPEMTVHTRRQAESWDGVY